MSKPLSMDDMIAGFDQVQVRRVRPLTGTMILGVAELAEELNVCSAADVDLYRDKIPEYVRDWIKYMIEGGDLSLQLVPLEKAPYGARVIGPAPLYCQACGAKL